MSLHLRVIRKPHGSTLFMTEHCSSFGTRRSSRSCSHPTAFDDSNVTELIRAEQPEHITGLSSPREKLALQQAIDCENVLEKCAGLIQRTSEKATPIFPCGSFSLRAVHVEREDADGFENCYTLTIAINKLLDLVLGGNFMSSPESEELCLYQLPTINHITFICFTCSTESVVFGSLPVDAGCMQRLPEGMNSIH